MHTASRNMRHEVVIDNIGVLRSDGTFLPVWNKRARVASRAPNEYTIYRFTGVRQMGDVSPNV